MNSKTKKMNAFDAWRIVLYLIVACSLIPSLCYSIFAFNTLGYHWYARVLFLGGAFVVEGVKVLFPKMAVSQKDWSMKLRSLLMFIGVLAMLSSLIFSYAFSVNENNSVKNEFIDNSDEAKTANKAVTTRDSLIKRLEKEITGLEAEKKAELSVLDPVNYRSKRAKITKTYNAEITKKSDKLTLEQTAATEPEAVILKTQKNVDVALGAIMTAKQEKMFFGFLVIFLEFAGLTSTIILSIPRKHIKKHMFVYEDEETDQDQEDNSNDGKVIDIDSKTKADRSIDLETPQNASKGVYLGKATDSARKEETFNNLCDTDNIEAIKIYSKEALRNIKPDNRCDGLDKIQKRTEYSRDKLRKAKSFLEHSNALQVEGMVTYVKDIDKLKSYA